MSLPSFAASPCEDASQTLVLPNPDDTKLTERVQGWNENGESVDLPVVVEKSLTLFLNGQEIVTHMTIADYPEYLAVGYLHNQNMLEADNPITSVEHDEDIETIIVRTQNPTRHEHKMKHKTLTSGCAQGTMFGDLMENFERNRFTDQDGSLQINTMLSLLKAVNMIPSLYLKAGAIHGCALCLNDTPIVYMEDVGRHNAVDKIAGYMKIHAISPLDKVFYTTGRLTSEMILKLSRCGFRCLFLALVLLPEAWILPDRQI